ncbi:MULTISPECIES: glycyl radical protein [Clostridium]|uniref:glycyl radical protein n=1 Tax=Clostridium TaxID=1485 RepID=UPI0005C1DC98|nr:MULTISPECIES: glycyl radical protein [Clostridium]AXB87297.1 formate C-acetyltransferase/glycerol dehydratase family glycyl radical enzyme [Clostridium butyricum]KIU05195.1 pyruvate formate-lyase [Clostridium butyricum]MBA8969185.1 formate C-acetyltransferase [Clostridium butyricum]MBA8972957.1 formate C-acetyltransferase [Clostridium butyricum]MBC2425827.1 glycyl radical protein [Clostridium butyricum]
MKNIERFGSLTSRMNNFREQVLEEKPYIDAERALLATESYKENKNQPAVIKRGLMLKNILEKMSIYIEDETLIVGNQASSNKDAPIFPEYTMEFVMNELDLFEKRDGDVFYITEKTKEDLRSIAPFWENNNLRAKGGALLPEEVSVFMETGFFGMEGKLNSGDAHLAADYETLLKTGLKGYEERTRKLKDQLDLCVPENIDKYQFYKAVLIVIDAVKTFAKRFSDLAKEKADNAEGKRKEELLEISRICLKIPYEPAETFKEALQSTWFIQLILQIESNGHSLSYGRFDQYMYPYYKHDIDNKLITEDEALELLTNLWIKTLTINKVRSQSHTFSSAGSPMYQNVTIGGQTTDKKDAVNELSYLILKSVAQTRLPQPNLTVRYHKNLDKKFMDECIEVMKLGTGMPAFNNDEVIIPSFIEKGVKEEDAYNYSAIGCVETAVPGKWGYRCTGMSYMNFPRILLIAMNNGIDLTSGKRFVEECGYFKDMTSFEQLKDAWDKVVRKLTRMSVIVENSIDLALERDVPDVLCSALTEDCIGRGKTIKEGGAVYDFISGLQVGIANMADSLAAIKKLVFEEKKITPEQLWNAIIDDFTSEESQKIQQMLINESPKYGNDDDYVDNLVVEAYDSYIDEMKKYPNTRYGRGPIGGIRYAGTSSISANVGQGYGTMATPDGRKARTPLAEGCSPAHSMDKNGPTAVFKTVSKLPTHEITGGVLLNQKVTPQMLSTEENKMKLEMMIRTFFNRLEGYHVQYNVVSRDTLIDAQLHPEKHRDLIVRVAGYSAFFNVLSKATQDDIIERTEQTL